MINKLNEYLMDCLKIELKDLNAVGIITIKSVSERLCNFEILIEQNGDSRFFEFKETLISLKLKHPVFFHLSSIEEIYSKLIEKQKVGKLGLILKDLIVELSIEYTIDDKVFYGCLIFHEIIKDQKEKGGMIENFASKVKVEFRKGTINDVKTIMEFIYELAEYEKIEHKVESTTDILKASMFGEKSYAESLICFVDDFPVGFAIYYNNFSTHTGKPGIWLDDLYVRPKFRGKGLGKRFLIEISKIALDNKCQRFEWWVLDWNEPSIEFYKRIGAVPMDEWTVYRLDYAAIKNLANQ